MAPKGTATSVRRRRRVQLVVSLAVLLPIVGCGGTAADGGTAAGGRDEPAPVVTDCPRPSGTDPTTGACVDSRSAPRGPSSEPEQEAVVTDPQAEPTWSPECGALVPEAGPSRLTVAGRFAATADASGQVLTGTVEVSVPTGADPISGVIAPEAFAFLVRDRRVLTEPLPQDTVGELVELAPGRSVVVPARASLARCAAAGGPVEPGGYEVWALMTVTGDDGTAVQALGGPWPVDVR